MTGGGRAGWYPDYEAPPGHQRYWNGERWTERRSGAPEEPPRPGVEDQVRRFAPWLLAAVAVLVVVSAAVLVVGDDQTARSSNGPSLAPGCEHSGPAGQ